jgi:pyrimidine operon attenuation protein / uracil phosphoribosyltransferase
MKILDNKQLDQKIERLAYQILENNLDSKKILFLGINKNGLRFANYLQESFTSNTGRESVLGNITLDAANPLREEIVVDISDAELNGASIIIVDDVANTGRTIFYAFKALLNVLPAKVEAAVLVDRKHKTFPVKVDYVGLSLATTLKENIRVDLSRKNQKSVFLE